MEAFESAAILASHEAFENYLDNLQAIARTMALMVNQDAELAATWLRHRKPRKGPRIGLLDRVTLSRRTRAHGRNAADALLEAVASLRKAAEVHAEYVRLEKKASPK